MIVGGSMKRVLGEQPVRHAPFPEKRGFHTGCNDKLLASNTRFDKNDLGAV